MAGALRCSFAHLPDFFRRAHENRIVSVAIAIPSDLERARAIITRGRRIARFFNFDWVAFRIARHPSRDLADLVSGLGGRLVSEEASDVASALIELTCREQARFLVIGRSRRPRLLRWLRRGTTERLLGATRPFDVVIASEGAEQ